MQRTKTIPNGAAVLNTFSAAEYEQRQTTLRHLMAEEGVDGVIFTSVHNINYYSDFLYCSFGRPYGLVVTEKKVVSLSANIDGGQPYRRTVGDNLVYTDWQRDNFFYAISQTAPTRGVIGIEYDHQNLQSMEKLKQALPGCTFKDISAAVMQRRQIKSAEEIAHIRQGAEVCDIGGGALVAAVAAGVPEYEVALAATAAMVREIAQRYPQAELMDTWTWFQSGINTDGAHNPVTSRGVQKGDILSLNCFSMIAGYYTALERTLFFDHVDEESLRLWEINVKVHEAGLKLIKPGVRCCDIAQELNAIYQEYDLLAARTFGYGHSFGVLCHYYGREAGLELREDIETVLQPNMVISMEPMIMVPQGKPGAGGYREHDILVLTETGAENITKFPYGPAHNVIFS
ncbi:MAG: aminopeptidase P family protein [Proteobacteria bacterium]|nr:aminopeptidase P family protein [Pseudomonadota bacterium]